MRENDEKSRKETNMAFALASFLLNVLIFVIMCGGAWMLHSYIIQPNSTGTFLRDFSMYR